MKLQRSNFKNLSICFVVCILCTYSTARSAYEQITSFNSDITVKNNGSMSVTETIEYDTDRHDRHGIVREFPTTYRDNQGALYTVDFDLTHTTLNDEPVPFKTERAPNGVRVFVGDSRYYLLPGTYTYTIAYTTNRQLGFFKNHDELYWNVTGTGWRLPIRYASARITLPQKVSTHDIQTAGYHGYYGSKNRHYRSTFLPDGSIFFETTKPLLPQQGLTIVAGWPKGIVQEPGWLQKIWWLLKDNLALLWLIIGSILMTCYYVWVYRRFTKDLQPGTIIPRFYPPDGMLPGTMNYIIKKRYTPIQLAASLVDMAVKEAMTIKDTGTLLSKRYTLHKKDTAPPEYQELHDILFSEGNTLSTRQPSLFIKAAKHLQKTYQAMTKEYFQFTTGYIIFGYVMTTLLFIPTSILFFESAQNWWYLLTVAILILINILATLSLPYLYTQKGLAVREEIDGFKLFLETTEAERLKVIGTPPTKTPQLYETYLPYAIALGVEQQWTEQFASVFKRLEQTGTAYTPVWYGGRQPFTTRALTNFTSTVSSASRPISIAASSHAPGSRSGFGRGGFSGGGGGGGGGGSW